MNDKFNNKNINNYLSIKKENRESISYSYNSQQYQSNRYKMNYSNQRQQKDFKDFMPDKSYFIPLGGSDEIGMNIAVYTYNNQWLVVDMGISFMKKHGIDIILADTSFLSNKKIVAIVITHGHEDHIGGIPLILRYINAPIYSTPFTIEMIHEKLKERDRFYDYELYALNPRERKTIGPFSIELVSVTHSIIESSMLYLETPNQTILHTGDWKFDREPVLGNITDFDRLEQIGKRGLDLLVCDSTNAVTENFSGTEQEVQDSLLILAKSNNNKRIFLTCFSSNLARIYSCILIAKATNRRVFVIGRSAHKTITIAQKFGYIDKNDINLVQLSDSLPERSIVICTGSQGEENSALSNFVFRNKIKENLDIFIFSSRCIPGNEKEVMRVKNEIIRCGGEVIDVNSQSDYHNIKKDFKIHVSGHPSREEISYLFQLTKPSVVIPYYGDQYHMTQIIKLARRLKQRYCKSGNGTVFEMFGDCVEKVGEVQTRVMGLDGNRLFDLNSPHINQRKLLGENGVVFVIIGRNLQWYHLGLTDSDHFVKKIKEPFLELLNDVVSKSSSVDNPDLLIKNNLEQFFYEKLRKKPIIVIQYTDRIIGRSRPIAQGKQHTISNK